MKLYEITDGYMNLLEKQDELSDEEIEEILEEIRVAIKEKSNNIIGYYKDRKVLLDAIDGEIKRLQEYKKIIINQVERYKEYVKDNMNTLGIERIETPIGKISIAKSPISINIIDENAIPSGFIEVIQTKKVDKKAIAEHFKETGEIVSGAEIIMDTHLRIS